MHQVSPKGSSAVVTYPVTESMVASERHSMTSKSNPPVGSYESVDPVGLSPVFSGAETIPEYAASWSPSGSKRMVETSPSSTLSFSVYGDRKSTRLNSSHGY